MLEDFPYTSEIQVESPWTKILTVSKRVISLRGDNSVLQLGSVSPFPIPDS